MSFANLSPADRLKVSALGALIVLVFFFVAHTTLGALNARKPDPAAAAAFANPTKSSAPAATPAIASASGAAVATTGPADPFPSTRVAQHGKGLRDDPELESFADDPFKPIRADQKSASATSSTAAHEPVAPRVEVTRSVPDIHRGSGGPDQPFSQFGGLPPMGGGGSGAAALVALAPPPEPQIKLIGIVHGDSSVATVQVGDRVMLARQGDDLAAHYRLMIVGPDGVVVRKNHQFVSMRVGGVINESQGETKK